MPVYLYRWRNGDFAEGCPIVTIKDFMVHFGLTDSGELEFQSYGETTENRIMEWGYPVLDEAWIATSAATGCLRLAGSKHELQV